MDDKKFIDNYFAITEHFQEFLISIKKNYQTIAKYLSLNADKTRHIICLVLSAF